MGIWFTDLPENKKKERSKEDKISCKRGVVLRTKMKKERE